jgi:hypothetical protein
VRDGQEPDQTPASRDETSAAAASTTPVWPLLPDNVVAHHTVDLDADDPALVDHIVNAGHAKNSRRRCVGTRLDGQRCASRAMHRYLTCSLHTGRMSPLQGAQALQRQRAERNARAEQVLALQRLGTRAVVAEALADEAEKVDRAVRYLVDAAANGDINAAKGLIPWIDQALGRPVERVEHRAPTGLEDLEFMSTEELERIVREGRARRLQREADDGDDGLV